MPTQVMMPQMGESIAEGTIVRWIKKVGDSVERDEPLFEISTDKVDAEIPSPAAGVLTDIRAKEGETVPVNTVVAVIDGEGKSPEPPAPAKAPAPFLAGPPVGGRDQEPRGEPDQELEGGRPGQGERLSPLVRRLAREHGVEASKIRGTGAGGRVTKNDVLEAIDRLKAPRQAPSGVASGPAGDRVEPMSVVRRKIAEHMVASRRTSAHVHSVFEADFSRVAQARAAKKTEYEQAGIRLTYLSFIVKAAAAALRAMPVLNASIDGDNIVYHKDVNIGIAVALNWGLIVPVIRHADQKDLATVSREIADLAERARGKQLKPDEVNGGTFTITNPGSLGTLIGLPIINQPQVAILAVGTIDKRPVVRDDAVVIRSLSYLSLGYDHRLVDGAVADQFMSQIKQTIETWE